MDIWGLCPDCDAWFACEGWFDRNAPHPRCPGCGLHPVAIENRAALIVIPDSEPAV
jgi:hypothetical protein